jgi:hypothetical protein
VTRRRLPSESTRFPDTIQKVVFEPFSASEFVGTANIRQILFGTGVHSKEISIAVREWSDDPKGWEKSWMERVIGSRGPW